MEPERALKLARFYTATRLAVLKAVAPEAVAALQDEQEMTEALEEANANGAEKAIAAAIAVLLGLDATPDRDDIDRALAAGGVAYNDVVLPAARSVVLARTPRLYRAGQMAGINRSINALRRAGEPIPVGLVPTFTLVDKAAVKAMAEQRLFWIGEHYEAVVAARIRSAAQTLIIEGGLGARAAADKFRELMEQQFGLLPGGPPPAEIVPAGWQGTSRDYFRMVVSNTATAARVAGSLRSYAAAGLEWASWYTAGDERVCVDICLPMDGKRFLVSSQQGLMDRITAAKTPQEAKEAAPWLSGKARKEIVTQSGHVSDEESAGLVEMGLSLPPAHGNCLLPGTVVQGRIVAASKALYSGQAVEVSTVTGSRLLVTPNHPILTPDGFSPAATLREGDQVVCYRDKGAVVLAGFGSQVGEDQAPSRVEDVFCALAENGHAVASSLSDQDFHGDAVGFQGQVEVVGTKCVLLPDGKPAFLQQSDDLILETTAAGQLSIASLGGAKLLIEGFLSSQGGLPSRATLPFDEATSLLDRLPLEPFCVGSASEIDSVFTEDAEKSGPTDAGLAGQRLERNARNVIPDDLLDVRRLDSAGHADSQLLEPQSKGFVVDAHLASKLRDAFPSLVSFDEIIHIRKFDFTGHVYDLQSTTGWIVAEDIFISNCRCSLLPVVE